MSSGWSYSQSTSMPLENIMSIYKEDLMESSSSVPASMVDSFCTTSQNLGFWDINVQNNAGSVNANAMGGWTPPNVVLRRDIDLHTSSSILRRSLSQIPTDSGFIERGARFSCFSGGNYGDMVNSFSIPGSINQQYTMGVTPMLGPGGVFPCGRLDSVSGGMSQENETNIIGGSKDVSMSIEHRTSEGSPNSGRKTKSLIRSNNEANQGRIESGNESFEVEISGGGDQAEPLQGEGTCRGTSAKGHGSKKRKKIAQDTELDQVKRTAHPSEATKHNSEIRKGDQSPASNVNKPSGKHGKLGHQASDLQKQEYFHVRARRGQATNRHSLAERVRREKISERMKYLQDIVPGCSKVTGKAVMLDEIINYVQSLQLQVEFLSMKLASVNPRMDFDIEGNTGKDILQPQTVSSSGLGFHSELSMRYPPGPPLHLSQPGTVQADLHGIGTSSDALKRTINSHMTAMSGGNKVSTSQVPDAWEDELDNVVQTGLVHAGHSKAEP